MTNDGQRVLDYWFGEGQTAKQVADEKSELWWSKNEATDRDIETRFGELSRAACEGELDDWAESAKGWLALIICTDQFPRNIYRGSPRSFAGDAKALALASSGLEQGHDRRLAPIQRVFAYLPFEHSETLTDQQTSLALFAALRDDVDAGERELFAGYHEFAVRHHEIVERFGRFPHRNGILGRRSTDQELSFLEQPGSSF